MSIFGPLLFPLIDPGTGTGLFALKPLFIGGMTRPVVDGDGGINIAVVSGHSNGVLSVIDPYTGMQVGDQLDIYWGALKIWHREVLPEELDQRLFFYLPVAPIVPGWVEEVYYRLTRNGSTKPDDPSVPLRLLVKLDRPAGYDKEPHKPGHSELKPVVLPDDVIQNGVTAEWAKKGVPLTVAKYPGIRIRDVIYVAWGSARLKPLVVSQAQTDGSEPIIIVADQEAILAGGDSKALVVDYNVHDELWNWSEKRSLSTRVLVDAGAWRLEPPIIRQSVNGVIDLIKLGKDNVTVQIHVRTEDFAKGDIVVMTWIGTPVHGEPLIHRSKLTPIENIPSILELEVPNADVRAIAMGRADVSYVLTKANGGPPLSSKRTFANVVGEISQLPAPTIREVIGDTLEPTQGVATVDIGPSPFIKGGDLIDLVWLGTKSDSQPYLHEIPHLVSDGEAGNTITLYVEAEHIKVLENGKLNLFYRVSNDRSALYGVSESEHTFYNVEAVRAELPIPVVVEADPYDLLDPSKVFDIATVRVEYLGMVKDDVLTYYWTGNPFNGSTSDWIPITSLIAGKPVNFRVDSEFVTANINRFVKVRYTLKRAVTGKYSYSATLDLLVGELVGDLPRPDVLQALNEELNPMNALNGVDVKASYTSMKPLLDTVALRWLGTPGAGTSDDLEQPGHESGSVQFHLPPSIVGANIDKTVTVDYSALRYGISTPSDPLTLKVLAFQNPEKELPRPHVPQANAQNVLDLMTFSGDARIIVGKWPFSALKQRVWLCVEGQTSSAGAYTIDVLKGVEITTQEQVSNGLNETLLRSELMKLGHSSPATVVCKVTFDGSVEEFGAVRFPSLPLTIRTRYDYLTPVITEVKDSLGDVPEGEKTRDTEVTFSGTATRGETIELFDLDSGSIGTAPVGADNIWTRKISNLTEKTYNITAKALYAADPVSSEPRTFTVKFAETPQIRSVTDSRGAVAEGQTTYDNSVVVEGSATPNERVQLLEGGTPILPLDVNDKGIWTHRLDRLTVMTYRLTAKALYDIDPEESPPRTFVVAQAVTPTISRVTDIKGEVVQNGTTYYKTVTLSGKASLNEKITLRDNSADIHLVDIKPDGTWEYVFTNLTLKSYNLTAKAEYGSGPISTPARVFTVAAHVSPSITSVTDSIGIVQPGGITYDKSVVLRGKATPREQVQIMDNATALGSPVPVDAAGDWVLTANALTEKGYSVTAKALYDVVPESSQPRTFTVKAHEAVTLTSVRDSRGELANGGSTTDKSVSLAGRVTPLHQVQIMDNGVGKHTVPASGDGDWSTTLAVPEERLHSITAKALSTGEISNARSFTVVNPLPPLVFNTSPVTLSGRIYLLPAYPAVLPAFGAGTSIRHQASGGRPGYTYTSSNTAVAVVDSAGLVTVRGRGAATITAIDQANQSKSYTVSVTGVIHCIFVGSNDWSMTGYYVVQQGARFPSLAELREIHNFYGNRWPMGNNSYWAFDRASNGIIARFYLKNLVNGGEGHAPHTHSYLGIGLK